MHQADAAQKMTESVDAARAAAAWIVEGTLEDSEYGFAADTIGSLLKIRISGSLSMEPYMRQYLEDAYGTVPEVIFVFHPVADIPGHGCFRDRVTRGTAPLRVGSTVWAMISIGGDPAIEREIALRDAREAGEEPVRQVINASHAMFLVPELVPVLRLNGNSVVAERNWRKIDKTLKKSPEGFRRWVRAAKNGEAK